MKKIIIYGIIILLCGCGKVTNSLEKNDYINKNDYNTVYNDLLKASNDVSYIPSTDTEKRFYELIEIISDNCNKFTKSELDSLSSLINENYQFAYSGNRYNNTNFQNDLNIIKTCVTE